jgi:hypothetical protein
MKRLFWTGVLISLLGAARPAAADDFFFLGVDEILDQLDGMTTALEIAVDDIDDDDRADQKARLDAVILRLTAVSHALVPGQWYQANQKKCTSFCKQLGLKTATSPENARCASGENRFPSAEGIISYSFGVFGAPKHSAQTLSHGGFCYAPGQKKDNDKTDRTVACFCSQ